MTKKGKLPNRKHRKEYEMCQKFLLMATSYNSITELLKSSNKLYNFDPNSEKRRSFIGKKFSRGAVYAS